MAQKALMKFFERATNGKRRHVFSAFGEGRTKKLAKAAATRKAREYLKRNVFSGFRDEEGIFHPIRASADYDAKRADESKRVTKKKGGKRRKR